MERREIEIQRNVIENFLMAVKNYARKNMKTLLIITVATLAVLVLLVAGVLYYDKRANDDMVRFEQILEKYRMASFADEQGRVGNLKKTAAEMNGLIDSSYWGYVNKNGYYVLASLYMNEKMYAEAGEYYLRFVKKSPSSFFAPMALQQAAIASEERDNIDEALRLYQRMDKEYAESALADQIQYDLGRMYQKKGDVFKSREHFNRVVFTYPQSLFARKAKERLFMLGLIEKKGK